jgi:nitrate/TMAO reductase-like tetraheme cytochrome c subunit
MALGGLAVGVLVGAPLADAIDRYFSSDAFCAETCHVMTATVAEEYKTTAHWQTPTGVRPGCGDCHVSEGLAATYWDHILGLRELYATVIGGITTVEKFEEHRAAAADRVRLRMVANDSKNCRTCHVMEAIQPTRRRSQVQHEEAREKGITCIVCHYDLVHKAVPPSDAFNAVIESY